MMKIQRNTCCGYKFNLGITFLFWKRKVTKRNHPRSALSCASPRQPAHAETRPPGGGLKQSACFFPVALPMLGAERRVMNAKARRFSLIVMLSFDYPF
jgi:hypothetical protein